MPTQPRATRSWATVVLTPSFVIAAPPYFTTKSLAGEVPHVGKSLCEDIRAHVVRNSHTPTPPLQVL